MSDMDPAIAADTGIAVELLRVWTERDPHTAATYMDAILNQPNTPDVLSIIKGQLNVATALLAMLAAERGAVTDEDMRKLASEILRELAGRITP